MGSIQTIKTDVSQFLAVARDRHRRGEDPFRVVEGFSDGTDGILRQLFLKELEREQESVALIAVGGYGRRELCPYSDIDLVFLRDRGKAAAPIERLVRLLWDGGFQLGHAVRTPAECFKFMVEDVITAATLLESRYLVGSQRLYSRFQAAAVNRYRKSRGEFFARTKFRQLRDSLEAPGRTIYVLEPHIKEGPCCLRDVQRVLWIENIRRGTKNLEELGRGGNFDPEQVAPVRDAYRFYLRLRCELHFANDLRQDILEPDSLVDVARNLGKRGSDRQVGEALMAEYYRHARNVYRFLRHYLETGTQGRRFLTKLKHKVFATTVKPYLFLYKGTLFLRKEPEVPHIDEEILDIFLLAHRRDAHLSESLCEWIRRKAADPALNFTRSTVIHRALIAILRGGRNTGRVLKTMRDTGILDRILPEFGRLNGLVNFDGHHQFTVDEHTLRTLEEMDRLETPANEDEDERSRIQRGEFRRVLAEIKDPLPLRLALLLHDIGKAMPGKHAVSGGGTAILVCERLGLDPSIIETVEFLIYRHLEMFKVSRGRDFTEDRVVESLARLVGTEKRLTMLYLLTYIDITSVGLGTWTAWKGAQLAELFHRTLIRLRTGKIPADNLEESLTATGLGHEERRVVVAHCERINTPGYVRETIPERMLHHARMVEKFLASGEIQVEHESFVGYHEIVICCKDRPHLFADLTGVLLSEGFNVLGARIFSRSDGVALDLFHVEVADAVQVDVTERVTRVRSGLRRIEAKQVGVEDLIRRRGRRYRFRGQRAFPRPFYGPAVFFDNKSSEHYTVIEVKAGDRPGLLYDLATTISRLGLDVRTAKVSTLTNRAHDVFYVVEADGQKVLHPARRRQVEQVLVDAAGTPSRALQGGFL